MENSPSSIHYKPATQQRVSGKTVLIVFASAIVIIVAVFAVAH
jgi:hypothetical protein